MEPDVKNQEHELSFMPYLTVFRRRTDEFGTVDAFEPHSISILLLGSDSFRAGFLGDLFCGIFKTSDTLSDLAGIF